MIDYWYDKQNNIYFATSNSRDLLQYIINNDIENILDITYIKEDCNNEKILNKLFKK